MIYSAIVRMFVRLVLPFLFLSTAVWTVSQTLGGETSQPDWIQSEETGPEDSSDWVQPESDEPAIPLVGPQAVTALRAQAFSGNLDAKSRVLATLAIMQEENRLSPDDQDGIDLISFLATESYDFQIRRDGRVVNDFPMIRAEAVQLLGSIGGPAATVTLQRVLSHEEDSFVLSQAVSAVAQAASEPSEQLLTTLTTLVNRMNATRRPDNALAFSVIDAVETLHDQSAGIDDPDLFRALIAIAQGGYSTSVRRAAARVIDKLRQRVR